MEAESTLKLFDCYWYGLDFFKKQQKNRSSSSTVYEPKNPDSSKFLSESPSMGSGSMSEQTMSSMYTKSSQQMDPLSPSSVLFKRTERLQAISSGKVAIPETAEEGKLRIQVPTEKVHRTTIRRVTSGEKRRKKKGLSKSLSDLEFSELKGFMDLGFVFSEEDRKDSSLSLIIPGLQRLGSGEDGDGDEDDDEDEETDGEVESGSEISRPYLSEAWELKGRRRKNDSLWRVPATSSEIDMKDYIKSWAHSVVSSLDR